jgi:hypothetical protein
MTRRIIKGLIGAAVLVPVAVLLDVPLWMALAAAGWGMLVGLLTGGSPSGTREALKGGHEPQ